ncbi:TRDC protein, partial [Bucorvus abyssinicus]|nr:TRDC protein [Bucorvus abyssinicus]
LKSKEPKQYDNKLNVACLARTFYPKNITLDVPKSDVVYDLKAPLVTSEGTYSAMKVVGVEPGSEVTCKATHKGHKTSTSTTLPGTHQDHLLSALLFKAGVKTEKANMLFMAVLGLRVLLAKSIAFNTLVTIKLFLF